MRVYKIDLYGFVFCRWINTDENWPIYFRNIDRIDETDTHTQKDEIFQHSQIGNVVVRLVIKTI